MVIDCKAISQAKRDAIKRKAAELDITPTLAVILAVDDPASRVYVRNKRRACEEVGFGFEMYSDINDDCILLHHVRRYKSSLSNGRNQDIRTACDACEVFGVRMAQCDRGVLLSKHN